MFETARLTKKCRHTVILKDEAIQHCKRKDPIGQRTMALKIGMTRKGGIRNLERGLEVKVMMKLLTLKPEGGGGGWGYWKDGNLKKGRRSQMVPPHLTRVLHTGRRILRLAQS